MKQGWKRQFITIYTGQAFSIIGSAVVQFAIVWWLTVRTQSAVTLTAAAVAGFLPRALIGPFAGVWIDRINRRTMMIAADLLGAAANALLGISFFVLEIPPVWLIYIVLFLQGVGAAFHIPAMQSAIPMLVPADMLTKAGGWGSLISSVSGMAGPVLGAALMELLPIAAIVLIDFLGVAFAVGCLLFVKIPDVPQSAEQPHLLSDMGKGLSAMRENRALMAVFFPMLLCNIAYMPLVSLLPLLIRTHFGGTVWHNSMSELAYAGGLLASSLVMGVWGGPKRPFLMVSLAIAALGLTSWASGALPGTAFLIFLFLAFIMGGAGTFINVPLMAFTQATTAPEQLGKVLSLLSTSMTVALPIGFLLAGWVSELIGADRWFLYSGAALVLVGLLCWVRTRPYDHRLNTGHTARRRARPAG